MSIFKDDLFQGKNAFITGGTSGINLTIAKRLSQSGAGVAVLGRNPEKAEKARQEIEAVCGGKVIAVTADVRDYGALEEAMRKAHAHLGNFDIVVAGAAGNFPAPALGMSANAFKSVIDIDLLGAFNTFRASFQFLNKPGAALTAISATQSFIPTAMQAHVCAAKAGIDMTVKTLAIEWGGAGVRVNCINPGPVAETEGMDRLTPTPKIKEALEKSIPLGRYATKDEIADLIMFLSSPAGAYITGATVVVDGGQSLVGSGAFMMAVSGK